MIFPDVSSGEFLKKYPGLAEAERVIGCGCPEQRPFITYKSIGLKCQICGADVWIHRDATRGKQIAKMLFGAK